MNIYGWLMLQIFKNKMLSLSRGNKRMLMLAFDLIVLPLALWSALVIRLGSTEDPSFNTLSYLIPIVVISTVVVFIHLGLYRAVIRFIGVDAAISVFKGVTSSAIILAVSIYGLGAVGFPRSVLLIYWLLAMMYVGGSRFLLREFFNAKGWAKKTNVAIYGSDKVGHQLSMMLANTNLRPVCFLDDKKAMRGSKVNGLTVYTISDLLGLVEDLDVKHVLLAIPDASRPRKREIVERLELYPVKVSTIPDIGDIVSGQAQVSDIREIDILDLLGRDCVAPNPNLLNACIKNNTVLVTGAGGSIGSELCRQIVHIKPKRLILLDSSEFALYKIEQELINMLSVYDFGFQINAVLGNVQDFPRMKNIFSHFHVDTIYHAAAYKHVPMVETNVVEGIKNNIIGTAEVAKAAVECNVKTFVLISTDKAVRPTNVMGATKRFAELILQYLSKNQMYTRFCMVRFGNVLGSSGSVVNRFKSQIKNGGPVTVTHPDIVRYFMTISEAAQLVIQAGSMGKGGDIYVLNMGQPVKISDLAIKMIHLAGLTVQSDENPHGDIKIKYTGLRPGEKLYEELIIDGNVAGTEHSMIMRAEETCLESDRIQEHLEAFSTGIKWQNHQALYNELLTAVCEYHPSQEKSFDHCVTNYE